jgi:hypothetical protein
MRTVKFFNKDLEQVSPEVAHWAVELTYRGEALIRSVWYRANEYRGTAKASGPTIPVSTESYGVNDEANLET